MFSIVFKLFFLSGRDRVTHQLDKRFSGQQMVPNSFLCLQIKNLNECSDEELKDSARKLQALYSKDLVGSSLENDLIHFRTDYKDTLGELESAKGMLKFIHEKYISHLSYAGFLIPATFSKQWMKMIDL